jgi:hypothetical protein
MFSAHDITLPVSDGWLPLNPICYCFPALPLERLYSPKSLQYLSRVQFDSVHSFKHLSSQFIFESRFSTKQSIPVATMPGSFDSGQRPLTNVNYQSANNPYDSGAGFYGESSGFLQPQPQKKRISGWIKFGIPILIIIAAGAIVGGILGSKAEKKHSSSSNTSANPTNPAAASSAVANKNEIGVFATGTDSYGLPIYPTNVSGFLLLF